MPYSFDSRSGCRERLFLLSVIDLNRDNPANWAYDSHRDVWSAADGRQKAVRWEASHSLQGLAVKGIDRKTALEMVGYPEK
jgi:hypothetical protein